ncbi:HupE/UreJ family protein [Hydrogenophaga sp.]|uniref:HupE/UreJ family protein n=1 Tax=Hydrogenophaga sp. TaxID=1904254 RepID=UPI003AF95759
MTSVSMRCFELKSRTLAASLLLAVLVPAASAAQAHKATYVRLVGGGTAAANLRVDVAPRDLDVAPDLDANGDGHLTWGEIRSAWPAIERYFKARVQIEGCDLQSAQRSLERRIDGVYAAVQWQAVCGQGPAPTIRYTVLADIDPTHRGLAWIEWAGGPPELRVLVPQIVAGVITPNPAGAASPAGLVASPAGPEPAQASTGLEPADPLQFLREGVRHILTGYDHVLFLLCLLLPSVMRSSGNYWVPLQRLAQAMWPVAGIVTGFTVAHSITLALAATGAVSLSPRFIEPAIAATIILTAIDNMKPIFRGRRALVTFGFGLIHGFGFAGVLAELDLPVSQFAWALLQFNVGLELGQLAIVVVVTALLFSLRRSAHYGTWVIRGGSIAAIVMGALWLVERTANVSLLPL